VVEKVTPVALRDVWGHEAIDFTPWLLKNLDFLNDILPFELVEAEREKAAGTSWVDIVAKDTEGGTVVIENQLGTSDHDHLGKVITYLATYEAKRAIWIVGDARFEHIEAINWLNKMGPVDFFLVRAEALRIGNSEPAAQFAVITGPSEPLRAAGDTKRRQASTGSRSFRDAIDESECYDTLPKGKRHEAARMTDYAIRLLWHRTGASMDAFAPRRTHAESLDFLKRHRRIIECVKLILTENSGKENKIGWYVSTGYAAGLLYLFGSSATDPAAYRAEESPNENLLNWDRWTTACDFFVRLAGRSRDTAAVHDAFARWIDNREAVNNAVRWAILVKAWNVWSTSGKAIRPKDLALAYKKDQDGDEVLDECPTCGGIDRGSPEPVGDAEGRDEDQ
jgi:hypothetical protein